MKRIQFRIDEKKWSILENKLGGKTNQEVIDNLIRRLMALEANNIIRDHRIKNKSK